MVHENQSAVSCTAGKNPSLKKLGFKLSVFKFFLDFSFFSFF